MEAPHQRANRWNRRGSPPPASDAPESSAPPPAPDNVSASSAQPPAAHAPPTIEDFPVSPCDTPASSASPPAAGNASSCSAQPPAAQLSTIQWQPPPPSEVRGRHRHISDILPHCTEDMGWNRLHSVVVYGPEVTLGHLDWRALLSEVWQSAALEGARASGVSTPADWHDEMHLETWQKILHACNLDTVHGMRSYVRDWGALDPRVLNWMQGSVSCAKPTADVGGWLADYCNTAFLTLSQQAKPNVLYKVVSNKLYQSLADLIGPHGLSPLNAGNVWEQLCWHAFEHDRGAFVLAVIWNTSNRQLSVEPANFAMPAGSVSSVLPPAEHAGLTTEQATNLQRGKPPNGLHKAMREHLQAVAAASEQNPYQRRCELPPTLPWREYIAFHDKCDLFVGPGIQHCCLYFMPAVDKQKTRGGQLRLNLFIERVDGTVVLLHPGGRPRNDAKPILLSAREFQLQICQGTCSDIAT